MPRPRVVHDPELYRPGDRVVVLDGPFAGETGQVTSVVPARDAIQVALGSGRSVLRGAAQLRNLTLPARLAHAQARARRAERTAAGAPKKPTSVRLDADVYGALQDAVARGVIDGRDAFINDTLRLALARLGQDEDSVVELRARFDARLLGEALMRGVPDGNVEIGALVLRVKGSAEAF